MVVPTERILPPLLNDLMKAGRDGRGPAEMIANTQPFNIYGIPAVTCRAGSASRA